MFLSKDIWYIFNNASISFTTTLSASIEIITQRLNIIYDIYDDKKVNYIPDLDFQVVIDLKKYFNDKLYKQDLITKFKIITNSNISTSIQFRVNFYEGMFDEKSHEELSNIFIEEFNAPFFVVPSFLHKNNEKFIQTKLQNFNNMLEKEFKTLSNINKEKYNVFDPNFRSYTWTMFSIYENNTFIMPFVYGQIMQRDNYFKVNLEDINESYIGENITLANNLECCSQCEKLITCASRCTHMYMHSRNIIECPYENKGNICQ
jgi:hypothetical protein